MEKSVAWKFSPHRVEGNTVTSTKLKHVEENLTAVLDGDINLMQNSNNEKMNRSEDGMRSILEEAQAAVLERGESYGHVEDSFTTIAKGWNMIVGTSGWPIDAKQVGLMMVWLKIAREMHRPKRDNLVDIAGYAECLGRLSNAR
jgi:hypothetical protein